MKRTLFYIITILLVLTGCSSYDELAPGTLELTLSVEQPVSATVSTRTVPAALQVEIWTSDRSSRLHQFAPGQSARQLTLDAGQYLLIAFTPNYQSSYANDNLGEAKYYAEQTFSILPNVVNRISCSVPMTNTAVCLTLPEGFDTWFKSSTFSVKQQATSRSVTLKEGETAYFDCVEGSADLLYTLTTINTDDELNTDSGTLTASAGTLYQITYSWATKSLMWKGNE